MQPRRHLVRARVGPPDPLHERHEREREANRDERLLDVPLVERPDQDELDERGEDGAEDEADHGAEQEAQEQRVHAVEEMRLRPPRAVGADGQERAVREVEDAHQAVDERKAGRDQEVHRAEPEARNRQQYKGAHA